MPDLRYTCYNCIHHMRLLISGFPINVVAYNNTCLSFIVFKRYVFDNEVKLVFMNLPHLKFYGLWTPCVSMLLVVESLDNVDI